MRMSKNRGKARATKTLNEHIALLVSHRDQARTGLSFWTFSGLYGLSWKSLENEMALGLDWKSRPRRRPPAR